MAIVPASEVSIPRAPRKTTTKPVPVLDDVGKSRLAALETEIDAACRAAKSTPILVTASKGDVTNQPLVDALTASFLAAGWSLVARKGRDGGPVQWEVRKAKPAKAVAPTA